MSRNPWTHGEIVILKRMFRDASDSELVAALPRHPLEWIKEMAKRQGLRKGNTRSDTMRKWQDIAARHAFTFRFGDV